VIRVLVAEDHTIVREGIKQLIGMARDLEVAGEACNGEQLLEVLRRTPCDVVLLDISMPGVNGLEAIPRIRALTEAPAILVLSMHAEAQMAARALKAGAAGYAEAPAILVLSMHDEAQMAARALKAGAAGYATKDSDPALLITAIRKVASGGRYIDPALADRMVFEVGLTDSRPPHAQLSEREFSVFERLVRGEGVNDIALHLAISNKTVSTHKARLMQKLGAHSMADLVRYAMEHRLV
jgi:DNA-binding NarL/FixJ family response regulator